MVVAVVAESMAELFALNVMAFGFALYNIFLIIMVKITQTFHDFTLDTIQNKPLILQMLQYEDKLFLSDEGQSILADKGMASISSLSGGKTIQRMVLTHFNFNANDTSLANYRRIFHYYYVDPTNYDADVLNSVFYMRENRCLYYTLPEPAVGDKVSDVPLLQLQDDGTVTETSLFNAIVPHTTTIVAAFSTS